MGAAAAHHDVELEAIVIKPARERARGRRRAASGLHSAGGGPEDASCGKQRREVGCWPSRRSPRYAPATRAGRPDGTTGSRSTSLSEVLAVVHSHESSEPGSVRDSEPRRVRPLPLDPLRARLDLREREVVRMAATARRVWKWGAHCWLAGTGAVESSGPVFRLFDDRVEQDGRAGGEGRTLELLVDGGGGGKGGGGGGARVKRRGD